MLSVRVELPQNRTQTGSLRILNGASTVLGPLIGYGKADNAAARRHGNPDRNPEFPYGDTPCGEWRIVAIIPTGVEGLPARSYGPHGALDLRPVSGSCRRAYDQGRHGIWIHGGDLSAAGRLRPTHGCLRLSNDDMHAVLDRLRHALPGEIPLEILEV